MTDLEAVRRAFDRDPAHRTPACAILVNNAGAAKSAKFAATDDASVATTCSRVNLTGTFHCTRVALPHARRSQAGRIVNIASTAGLVGYPYVAAYCAAKHGVIGLTRALALELAGTRGDRERRVPRLHRHRPRRRRGRQHRRARPARRARRRAPCSRRAIRRSGWSRPTRWRRRSHGCACPASQSITGQAIAVAGGEVTVGMSTCASPSLRSTARRSGKPRTRRDHDALRLWLRLLTCTLLIERSVKTRLRESFAMTLPRFDLMAQLERAPGGLKMSELSRRLMVTGGNVTGLTDQLVGEGLVERRRVPGDRRALAVVADARRGGRRSWRWRRRTSAGSSSCCAACRLPTATGSTRCSGRSEARRGGADPGGMTMTDGVRTTFRDYRGEALPLRGHRRRQRGDDHARPSRAQESADVRSPMRSCATCSAASSTRTT